MNDRLRPTMDQDGITDLGLFVPDRATQNPENQAEWYFLISNDPTGVNRVTGSAHSVDASILPNAIGERPARCRLWEPVFLAVSWQF